MVIVFLPAVEGLQAAMARGLREPGRQRLGLLAARRPADPVAVVPRRHAAAVRQRLLGLRHGQGPDLAGEPARAAAHRHLPDQRDRPGPGEPRQGAGVRHDRRRRRHHGALRAPAAADVAVAAAERRRPRQAPALGRAAGGRRLPAAAAARDARVLDPRHRRARAASPPGSQIGANRDLLDAIRAVARARGADRRR